MTTKRKSIWLNYDFGLKGNYSALFEFLDNHNALDCGNGLAYFLYENKDNLTSEKVLEKLKVELEKVVQPSSSDKIYIIWKDENVVKGKFLFGNRKTPVWNGYSNKTGKNAEEEAF